MWVGVKRREQEKREWSLARKGAVVVGQGAGKAALLPDCPFTAQSLQRVLLKSQAHEDSTENHGRWPFNKR
jgi:hypothetical protein